MVKKDPIFIVGCPRSGTTILYKLLAGHPDLSWISLYTNKFPSHPGLSFFSKIFDVPFMGDKLWNNMGKFNLPRPVEGWNTWEYISETFSRMEPVTEEDITSEDENSFHSYIEKLKKFQMKERFLGKYARPAKIRYLSEIFPNSVFIHIMRDGRAVSNSLINKGWMDGVDHPKYFGDVKDDLVKEWKKYDKSVYALAAVRWKFAMDEIEKQKTKIQKNRLFELSYEQLAEEKNSVMKEIIEFSGLELDKKFLKRLDYFKVENRNWKWKEKWDNKEKVIVEDILDEYLKKYGYE